MNLVVMALALAVSHVSLASAEKILVVHPVYAGSHVLALRSVLRQLVTRGHQIKVIRWKESSAIPTMKSPNVSELVLAVDNSDGNIPFMTKHKDAMFEFPDKLMWDRGLLASSVFDGGIASVAASCETLLTNKSLFHELKFANFKLAIVDLIFNECGLVLAHKLSLPVVAYWGISFTSGETQYTTAFNPPSSIPHVYLPFTDRMNFFERFVNFLYGIGSHIVMQVQFYQVNYHIQRHLEGSPHPSQLLPRLSGMLINSHGSFDYPRQLPPSFFQIGGFHIQQPRPLAEELKDFMDSAEEGVVLFCLGKNFDSKSLPRDTFEAYFRAFEMLTQKIIVKSSGKPKILPPNVKILPYVPQADILAHPKTILFVTHCGLHSVMEAIHFGVKMIALPIFFDQGNVAARLVDQGIALPISKTASQTDIFNAITKVINDKRYDDNMQRVSDTYHNSFEKPMDRAIWLIEHVMHTNGANYMKLSTKDLNFVQYFCLDVISVLILCLVAGSLSIWKLLVWTINKFISRNNASVYKIKIK